MRWCRLFDLDWCGKVLHGTPQCFIYFRSVVAWLIRCCLIASIHYKHTSCEFSGSTGYQVNSE